MSSDIEDMTGGPDPHVEEIALLRQRILRLEAVAEAARRPNCFIIDYQGGSHNMLEEAIQALDAAKETP